METNQNTGTDNRPMTPNTCQIVFTAMEPLDAARVEVRAWLPKLGALLDGVTAARVVIEAVAERRKEQRYAVRMEFEHPGGAVAVTHAHPRNGAHEDVYVAIRNGFRAARIQLEDQAKIRIA